MSKHIAETKIISEVQQYRKLETMIRLFSLETNADARQNLNQVIGIVW